VACRQANAGVLMRPIPSSQLTLDFRGPRRALRWTGDEYTAMSLWLGADYVGMGVCPVEAGFLGALVDHECRHGLLPGERTCCP
jgi:hypothetical protein